MSTGPSRLGNRCWNENEEVPERREGVLEEQSKGIKLSRLALVFGDQIVLKQFKPS